MAAPPERVYAALATLGEYPTWWPQVRSVEQVTQETAVVRIRSVLPYTLQLVLTREVEDRAMGLLRVRIRGDLSGWSQWEVLRAGVASRQPDRAPGDSDGHPGERGAASVARFTEQVEVTGALRPVARPAAVLLRANHRAMMHAGARGLDRLLAERPSEQAHRLRGWLRATRSLPRL